MVAFKKYTISLFCFAGICGLKEIVVETCTFRLALPAGNYKPNPAG
jgi:hypothetical protein